MLLDWWWIYPILDHDSIFCLDSQLSLGGTAGKGAERGRGRTNRHRDEGRDKGTSGLLLIMTGDVGRTTPVTESEI